jgi:hypothetical protein
MEARGWILARLRPFPQGTGGGIPLLHGTNGFAQKNFCRPMYEQIRKGTDFLKPVATIELSRAGIEVGDAGKEVLASADTMGSRYVPKAEGLIQWPVKAGGDRQRFK